MSVLEQQITPYTLWLLFGTVGVVGFFACRRQPWWLLLFTPLLVALGIPVLLEMYDPVVGPQLWRESKSYVLEVHAAFLVSLVLPLLGARSYADRSKFHT